MERHAEIDTPCCGRVVLKLVKIVATYPQFKPEHIICSMHRGQCEHREWEVSWC